MLVPQLAAATAVVSRLQCVVHHLLCPVAYRPVHRNRTFPVCPRSTIIFPTRTRGRPCLAASRSLHSRLHWKHLSQLHQTVDSSVLFLSRVHLLHLVTSLWCLHLRCLRPSCHLAMHSTRRQRQLLVLVSGLHTLFNHSPIQTVQAVAVDQH